MGKPRNPNPPVRTQLVKNKKAKDTVWYVIERKVQYSHEKQTNIVLDSNVIGILKNKEDDYKDMIPIEKWNEQKKQEREENKKAKIQAINDTKDKAGHKPLGSEEKAAVYEKGRQDAREEIAVAMLKNSFSLEQIQLCTSLSPSRIVQLAKENSLL